MKWRSWKPRLATAFAISAYLILVVIALIEIIPGFGSTRPIMDSPTLFWPLFAIYVALQGYLTYVYLKPVRPTNYSQYDTEEIIPILESHWKIGRLVVAITVVVIAGITVPFSVQVNSDTSALFGLAALGGVFGSIGAAVGYFYWYRYHYCERYRRSLV